MTKPLQLNRRIIIRCCALAIVASLLIFSGACQAPRGSMVPSPTDIQPTKSPAASVAPMTTPVPTTPPDETPRPVMTPLPAPTTASIGKAVCTAKESVNIRDNTEKGASVLGALPAGETADVLAYEDGWAKIRFDGMEGYVNRDYLMSRHAPSVEVPSGDWASVVVNPSHPLPDGFEAAVTDFEGGQVDARILDICAAMFADAAEDGVKFKLVDAYRSFARQNELYEQKVQSYVAKGCSREEAETQAATITARPNTSEHQTGLALDIVTPSYTKRDKGFASTDAFKWLTANAQDYGFTLRYKQGKQELTGVIYEPWHWRFVGVEAARAMKLSAECLEEYDNAGE